MANASTGRPGSSRPSSPFGMRGWTWMPGTRPGHDDVETAWRKTRSTRGARLGDHRSFAAPRLSTQNRRRISPCKPLGHRISNVFNIESVCDAVLLPRSARCDDPSSRCGSSSFPRSTRARPRRPGAESPVGHASSERMASAALSRHQTACARKLISRARSSRCPLSSPVAKNILISPYRNS